MQIYYAVWTVLLLLALTAPAALAFGFAGAAAARSAVAPLRWIGKTYIAVVRGVPDIAFFLFFVIALDQLLEYIRHRVKCPDWEQAVWQGNDFVVCQAAKLPLGNAPQWVHDTMPLRSRLLPLPSCSALLPPMSFMARCAPCRAASWKPPKPMA